MTDTALEINDTAIENEATRPFPLMTHRVYSWNSDHYGLVLIRPYFKTGDRVYFLTETGVKRRVSMDDFYRKARPFTLRQLMFWRYPRKIT